MLDRVAVEARSATGAASCSIILLESSTFDVRLVGTAGHEDDYLERLMESVRLGAPLASLEAFRTRLEVWIKAYCKLQRFRRSET